MTEPQQKNPYEDLLLNRSTNPTLEQQEEKKPQPPKSQITKKEPKQLCCSRSQRFRDWGEIVGLPGEDLDKYCAILKKHFQEHDEDSEQEEHESYQEEMDEWKAEMWEKAEAKLEQMDRELYGDDDYEEEPPYRYNRAQYSMEPPQQLPYSKLPPPTYDDGVIYD